jgi:hypothetical protein
MKRFTLLLVLVLCLPLTARADEASRRVKAQEMVILLHMDTLMQQMMDTVQKQASAMALQVTGDTLTPQQQVLRDDFNKKAFALVESRMGWKALEPDILDLYARNFTDEELDAMLAFYKSPAGVSMIAKTPTLSAQSSQIALARMTELMPELKQMALDFAKAAKAAKPDAVAPGKSQPDASATDRGTPQFAGIANSGLEYARELDEIVNPATREKAADALVVYATTHPDSQNHIAHVFASRHTHLGDALTLAQESVDRIERQTASIDIDHVSSDDIQTMEDMAEYWDSLGWVRYAQGDLKAAKRYCQKSNLWMYDSLAVETQEPAVVRRFASILILLLIATLPTHAQTICEAYQSDYNASIFRGYVSDVTIDQSTCVGQMNCNQKLRVLTLEVFKGNPGREIIITQFNFSTGQWMEKGHEYLIYAQPPRDNGDVYAGGAEITEVPPETLAWLRAYLTAPQTVRIYGEFRNVPSTLDASPHPRHPHG